MKPLIFAVFLLLCLWLAAAAPLHALTPDPWHGPYRLAPGDDIRVTVAGEDDLSGVRRIGTDGAVVMPLIGAVSVAGRDIAAAADAITARLRDGYLRTPRVAVTIENFRPVYLLGGVKNPGEYPYREGMTVLQAVAMGGGFADNGRDHTAQITRRDGAAEITAVFSIDGTVILPGDVLKINSRWRYHE